jgi:ankyrin repeat protein
MGFFGKLFSRATETKEEKVQRNLNQEACEAGLENNFKLALELLAQGANPNYIGYKTEYSYDGSYKVPATLSYSAVKHNNEKAMMALIERGLDVNISLDQKTGKPLLMHTIESRNERLAGILVDHGADYSFVRSDLETCKSLAEAYNMTELLGKMAARENPSTEAKQDVTAMKPIVLKKSANTP